jgi:hypothetical protein
MNKGVLGGGMLVLALMAAGPLWAEGPMSPVKRMSPGAAKQWVEPPAADKAEAPPSAAAADAANAANAREKPPAKEAEDNRRPRSSQRAGGSGGSTASRLNRQELSRIRSGAGSYYSGYYRGYGYYGQPAYSYSGY